LSTTSVGSIATGRQREGPALVFAVPDMDLAGATATNVGLGELGVLGCGYAG